ncbi:MAG: CPBP family intramembrane glutamic endopeptidase [Pseudomonadota bacterium]
MKTGRAALPRDHRRSSTPFFGILRAVALGLPGIVAVVLLVPPPPGIPAIALAVNPVIVLCAAGFAGSFAAPRLGLRSAILLGDTLPLRSLLVAFGLGAMLGLGLAGLDCATASIWRGSGSNLPALCESSGLTSLALGFLYGGVTEELIMRWGVLSIITLGFSMLTPIRWAMGLAVILSAALFALAHLPALWLATPDPTTAALIRTLVLNTVAGLVFGLLYVRSGLEAAMLSHIGFHCGALASGLVIGLTV